MLSFQFKVRKGGDTQAVIPASFPDLSGARIEAAQLMAAEIRDHTEQFWSDEKWIIEVTDDKGLILFSVFSFAITSASSLKQG